MGEASFFACNFNANAFLVGFAWISCLPRFVPNFIFEFFIIFQIICQIKKKNENMCLNFIT